MNQLILARHILQDNESILAYEQGENVSGEDVLRRIIAQERLLNHHKSDAYYQGIGSILYGKSSSLMDFLLKIPQEVARYFFTYRNGRIFISHRRFPEWMDITTSIIPSWLLAAHFCGEFDSSCVQSKANLLAFANKYLKPFRYSSQLHPSIDELDYLVNENKGLSDLHIHLNGTTETDVVWCYILAHINEVSALYNDEYNKNQSVKRFAEQVFAGFRPQVFNRRLKKASELREAMLKFVFETTRYRTDINVNTVLDIVGDMSGNPLLDSPVVDEIMFMICTMSCLRDTGNLEMMNKFHHYLLLKGLIHRFLVMQTTQYGFPQFQMITENPFRELIEKGYEERYKQLAGTSGKAYVGLIEGRFSPKKTDTETLLLVDNAIRGFHEAKKKTSALDNASLRLIAHFIKRPESESAKSLPIRHRTLRQDLWVRATELIKLLNYNPRLKDVVCGVDAAASELDAGPEVFAPIYRYLRKNDIKHFTYHVGEDFRHLVSGIRAIYEAVVFLDLKQGDRLGHATAVGIKPELWVQRCSPSVILSQGEWLDDLVFVWCLIKKGVLPKMQDKLPMIESEIQEYSYRIYKKTYPPFLLAKAWHLRYYDPFAFLEQVGSTVDVSYIPFAERTAINEQLSDSSVMKLLGLYHSKSTSKLDCPRLEYDKMIEVDVDHLISVSDISEIQDYILSYLAQHEIVIEALPTSNLRISYYDNISEYHLGRWMEQGSKKAPHVVLGTDDPGIFYTNIYNEYSLAYCHLSDTDNSAIDVYKSIETLIRNSKIFSFDR